MHQAFWPFETHPLYVGELSWLGMSGQRGIVNYFESTRQDITVRAYDHNAMTVLVPHFRCSGTWPPGLVGLPPQRKRDEASSYGRGAGPLTGSAKHPLF